MALYVPGTSEKDPSKVIMALQNVAGIVTTNTANIVTNTASTATNTANIATNTANITTNTAAISALQTLASPIHASLGADVLLNNIANYFDGPSVAQGSTGTWFVSGTVTLNDTGVTAAFNCKLWDGTTVIASARGANFSTAANTSVSLSGYIASPAGNLRISVNDPSATTGKIIFNASGNSKDSTISAYRIA